MDGLVVKNCQKMTTLQTDFSKFSNIFKKLNNKGKNQIFEKLLKKNFQKNR